MNWKIVTIGVVIVAVVAVSAFYITSRPSDTPDQSLAGADTSAQCVSIGGVKTCYLKVPMTTASTTCNIQLPAAKSRLMSFSADFTTGPSSALSWVLATSTTKMATTTALATRSFNGKGSFAWVASTTVAANPVETGIMTPSNWLVWGPAIGGTNSVAGTCQAVVQIMN